MAHKARPTIKGFLFVISFFIEFVAIINNSWFSSNKIINARYPIRFSPNRLDATSFIASICEREQDMWILVDWRAEVMLWTEIGKDAYLTEVGRIAQHVDVQEFCNMTVTQIIVCTREETGNRGLLDMSLL